MNDALTFFADFLDRAFTLPTAVWSVLLILVCAYWLLSSLSGVDADALDGVDGLDGGLDHALDGGLDQALDGGLDHALDGGLDHALDGGLDHALDAGADHAMDALDGHSLDGHSLDGHHGVGDGHTGLMEWLGFREVPLTFSLSLVVVFGWLVSYFGAGWLVDAGKWTALGMGAVLLVGVVSVVAGIGLTAVALIPLRNLLELREGPRRIDLLGQPCTVKTGRVDEHFGQAETAAGQIVQVRARDGHAYGYGEAAVIFDYDRDKEVFYIAPLDDAFVDSTPAPFSR